MWNKSKEILTDKPEEEQMLIVEDEAPAPEEPAEEEEAPVIEEPIQNEVKKLPTTGKVPFFKDGVNILRPVTDRYKYESTGWKLVY